MFFDKFREALARLPAGLIRPGPAASPAAIEAVQVALGTRFPEAYAAFLRSFDGVDLFHEAIIVGGVGPDAARRLESLRVRGEPDVLIFAEAPGGDRFAFDPGGRVLHLRGGSSEGAASDGGLSDAGWEERWLAGGDFERWLDGTIAHQRLLYGPDGEFSPDAFEPDGAEVVPVIALRQTERALRLCDDSAEWHHERGVALRRIGRPAEAAEAFARAAALDPANPWPWFDGGRATLELGPAGAKRARAAFVEAARVDRSGSAARLWVWAARAALVGAEPDQIAACRAQAQAEDPNIGAALARARDAAREEDDPEALAEAEALLAALEGAIPSARARLPVLSEGPAGSPVRAPAPGSARRTPPPGPRRPRPGGRPPRGGPRSGSRR